MSPTSSSASCSGWLTHTIFRIRIVGNENVPSTGRPAGLESHVARRRAAGRRLRAALRPLHGLEAVLRDRSALNWFFRMTMRSRLAARIAATWSSRIRAARAATRRGPRGLHLRRGRDQPHRQSAAVQARPEKIVEGMDVPIVPVHLDRVWGSIFSFEGGKFFWKWPKRIPYPVTVSFGAPLPRDHARRTRSRRPILELGSDAVDRPQRPATTCCRCVHPQRARRNWNRFAMADSTGRELTYGETLIGSLLVSRLAAAPCRPRTRWSACCCPPASAARWSTSGRRWRARCRSI